MALNLSQLLGGAGVAAGSMRQAEEAERVARQNQLAIEERNRLDQLRQEMLRAPMPQVPQFNVQGGMFPVRQIAAAPTPAAPAAPGLAQPMSREQAAFLEANVEYPPFQAASTRAARAVPTPSGVGRMAATSVSELPPGVERLGVAFEEARAAYRTAQAKLDRYGSRQRQADPAGYQQARMDAMRAEQAMKQAQQLYETAASPLLGAVQVQPRPPVPARTAPAPAAAAAPAAAPAAPAAAPAAPAPAPAAAPAAAPAGLALTANDAIARVLQREGGYVDDPADSGGKTRFGITEAVARRAGYQGDMRELPLDLAERIYRNEYWDAINADQLPANIRELAFDAAVNQGVGWTKGALAQAGNDPQRFMQLREARYRDIVAANPSQQKFLAGWMNRLRDLAGGVVGAMVPSAQAAPTAAAPAAPAGAPATGAAPVQVKSSAIYLKNPDAITQDMRVATQQREELARLAQMYQNAGMGPQFMEARARVMEMDNSMIFLQGMRGIEEFSLAGDPRRLAAVWSAYFGAPVGVQRRSDGLFDVIADGERVLEGLTANAVVDRARSSFDTAFRKQKAEAAATAGMEEFKSVLRRQEQQGKDLAQMIREIAVERVRGNNAQALEWAKNNYGWDIKPTGSGDGSVIIRPPGGSPYLFNPTGKTIEIDGVKVQSNAAYPIAGLPTYGGVQPNR